MKSRTLSCNAVLKKDILRFAPTWGLYSGFLLFLSYLIINDLDGIALYNAQTLCAGSPFFAVVCFGYAILNAQLLFGYLCDSRMCNSIHAFPLRRESWFFTHVTAGLLFFLVPTGAFALIQSLLCGEYLYVPFLWLAQHTMQYLFFFGLAVLCMFLTGSRFASALVYLGFNGLSMVAYWIYESLLLPLMYGVQGDDGIFLLLCPLVSLCSTVEPMQYIHSRQDILLSGPDWAYVAVLAGLGLLFLGASLLLYRRRKLECAGDFVAENWEKPIFLSVYSLCAGTALAAFISLLYSYQNPLSSVVWILIGLAVGVITGRMLLQRTPRVFDRHTLRSYLALGLAVVAVMVLFTLDAFGIRRYVPQEDQVAQVNVSVSGNSGLFTDRDDIQKVLQLHQYTVDNYGSQPKYSYSRFTLTYTLTDGRIVERRYKVPEESINSKSPLWTKLMAVCTDEDFLFGTNQGPLWEQKITYAYLSGDWDGWELSKHQAIALLDALRQDAREGNLLPNICDRYIDKGYPYSVEFTFDCGESYLGYSTIAIPQEATHAMELIASFEKNK